MKTSRFLLVGSIFILTTAVDCQKRASCSNYVYDMETNERIPGASIKIESGDNEGNIVQTNENGEFSIHSKTMNGKEIILSISKEGYTTENKYPCNSYSNGIPLSH